MIRGRVYVWVPDPGNPCAGRVEFAVVPLQNLDESRSSPGPCLTGRFVTVRNGAVLLEGDQVRRLGAAEPGPDGNLLFEPGIGGGRIDKVRVAEPDVRERYIAASRFGEVNAYFHLDRMATYVHELLEELDAPALPRVTAVVHAHAAGFEENGVRDGIFKRGNWLPFQGGHYRLPSRRYDIAEPYPLDPRGEIHLGPGRSLQKEGALAEFSQRKRYRANASHNAGVLYHEYGHHMTRHLADFRANRARPADDQDNRKPAIDEGSADYWAAAMLGTPHVWALHWGSGHPRSLVSRKTMADYDGSRGADSHANGTVWGAALWDLRVRVGEKEAEGGRRVDRLVLCMLQTIGRLGGAEFRSIRRVRSRFGTALSALLRADERVEGGRFRGEILDVFGRRGILPETPLGEVELWKKEVSA